MPPAQITPATSSPQLTDAARLFAEYARSIAPIAGASLAQQGFDAELACLPGKYAAPRGVIVLGLLDALPVACAALRPLDAVDPTAGCDVAEVKRMYVQPHARGLGVGRAMMESLFAFARSAGYRVLKLDTSAEMTGAIGLYTAMGFVRCHRYNKDPDPTTLWFEHRLG